VIELDELARARFQHDVVEQVELPSQPKPQGRTDGFFACATLSSLGLLSSD